MTGSAHEQMTYGPRRIIPDAIEVFPPLSEKWRQDGASGPILVLEDGRLISAAQHRGGERLRALDADGKVLWSKRGQFDAIALSPVGIIANAETKRGSQVVCVDASSGHVVRRGAAGFFAANVVPSRHIVLGFTEDRSLASCDFDLTMKWRVAPHGSGRFDLGVAASDDACFVGCGTQLHAYDINTGHLVWRCPLDAVGGSPGPNRYRPSVFGDTVLVGTATGLSGIDAKTGKVEWSAPGIRSWATTRLEVFSLDGLGNYTRLDRTSGRVIRTRNIENERRALASEFGVPSTGLAVAHRCLFFGDSAGFIWAIDRESGEVTHGFQVQGVVFGGAPLIATHNRLVVNGMVGAADNTQLLSLGGSDLAAEWVRRKSARG